MTSGNITRSLGLSALTIMSIAGLAITGSVAAHANITPDSAYPTTGNGIYAGDTSYTYNVSVDGAETVVAGDYFTIYDFQGLVSATAMPTNWVASYSLLTTAPQSSTSKSPVSVTDEADIWNVTFTYEPPTTTPATTVPGPQSIGKFTIESIYGIGASTTASSWASYATQSNSPFVDANQTQVVSADSSTSANPHGPGHGPLMAPEPGVFVTAASMLSMTGLGLVRGRRRAKGAKVAA